MERHLFSRQHSLESFNAFGDSDVEPQPGMELSILGGGLLLNLFLSPDGSQPYHDVVSRVTTHLRLIGDRQDALTATIH